jgi:hypothetical protein
MLILLVGSIKDLGTSGTFIPCLTLFPKYLHFAYLSPAVEMNISLVVAFDGAVIPMLQQ